MLPDRLFRAPTGNHKSKSIAIQLTPSLALYRTSNEGYLALCNALEVFMNLLDSILTTNGGGAVSQLAKQFGLREDQTASAIQNLVPALAGGLHRNISQGGLADVLGALTKGQHQRYLDDPSSLVSEEVRDDGNKILGHVLGSKDVSRQVAAQASQRTGISESILKQMLPAVASLTMAALSKGASSSGRSAGGVGDIASAASSGAGSSILGMVTSLLDRNADGSVKDDILGMASGFFKKVT
jgi:hypothetical protein